MLKIIIYSIIFSSVFTQTKQTLSLDEAIAQGLANNRFLKISAAKKNQAIERADEVYKFQFASLSVSGQYARLSDIEPVSFGAFNLSKNIPNNYMLKLTIQQPLFTGFNLSSLANASEFLASAQSETFNKDKTDIIYKISESYWNLFKVQQLFLVVTENLKMLEQHVKDVANMYKQGMIVENELIKVKYQLSDLMIKKSDTKNNLRLANLALNNLIGLNLSIELDLTEAGSLANVLNLELVELIKTAIENRSDLKASDYIVKASDESISSAKSNYYPQIFLGANYNYNNPNQRIFPQTDEFKGTWDVGISAKLDLWNWFQTDDKVEQAEYQNEQAIEAYNILKESVNLEVTQVFFTYTQATERVSLAKESVKLAEQSFKNTNSMFKQGVASSTDLLDAETALLQAKSNQIIITADLNIALANLNKVINRQK